MPALSKAAFLSLAAACPLMAGTVVITSLPDAAHPLSPLTSLSGIPLVAGVQIRVGAFPGMSDDAVLNAASTGGFAQISSALVPFGQTCSIGQGVEGAEGNFEIAVRQDTADSASPLTGQTVSLLIQQGAGQEFLIARFVGKVFEADPDTGLEPILTLHLADAKILVGNRYGPSKVATTPAPAIGSFDTWISGFPAIIDPAKRMLHADADGDGRSNFLEYTTGGDPASAVDPPPCQLVADESGGFWIRFSRATGIGSSSPQIESTADLASAWNLLDGTVEPDPPPPSAVAGLDWVRIHVPLPAAPTGFFRLTAESNP
jgi:hypothetical protein